MTGRHGMTSGDPSHPSRPQRSVPEQGERHLQEGTPLKAKARASPKARARVSPRARARAKTNPASSRRTPTQTASERPMQTSDQRTLKSDVLLTSSGQHSQIHTCSLARPASPKQPWQTYATVAQMTDARQWLYQLCDGLSAYSSVRARKRRGMSPTTRRSTNPHLPSVPFAASWQLHRQHEGQPPQLMLQHHSDPLTG